LGGERDQAGRRLRRSGVISRRAAARDLRRGDPKDRLGRQPRGGAGLTREQAIRTVTSNSAYTSFEEHFKGSIEPGKYADFVVLTQGILTVRADAIKNTRVAATVLGGKTVHGMLGAATASSSTGER
jgi:predicted amidohydrolase YtcJ